ncbi:MAG: DUF2723 domain-containing protein [Cytophagales bacterium]|nr:MAG: DUF2723 domain-containing protein [Cytophagales bacterium]
MSNYHKINNITGWVVFAIATAVYVLTLEPTASFWDCGEFIACSYKLQVPHPPGAPLFLLIGRFFSLFAAGDVTKVAFWVNMVSALSSSFTILFLFWTITLLAKKVLNYQTSPDTGKLISIMGAGIVGSLAFTFTDSFWFSAVEAEVYAMSSFFTAFVFWAILKWEEQYDKVDSDKWLILIAYMMGLSIGVHLLNLVAVPALGYVYYFRKYPNITNKGLIYTFLISAFIIVFVLEGIIPGLPSLAGKFELFFVNSMSLPFGSGIIIFILLILSALIYGFIYSIKKEKYILNTALLSLVFILIGYISYGLILVRSNFNPPIDENDPENIISFVSYLKREQYGDRPLFTGPYFTAGYPIGIEKGTPLYRKDDASGKYLIYDHKMKYTYDPKHMGLFPRAHSTQQNHAEVYRQKMKLKPGKRPTKLQDLEYMFSYQIGHMYFRYFLWNFSGRESDQQDAIALNPWDHFKEVPDSLKSNKARNNYFWLPLILGLLGIVYHFNKNKRDASIVAMFFFFTGLAIILYLNQPPVEPRERDYTYTGSFMAFSIWIGFGVLFIAELLQKVISNEKLRPIIATILGLVVPGILAAQNWDDHDRAGRYHSVDSAKNLLNSCAKNAILFTGGDNDTFPLWYVQEVEGFRTDVRVCNLSLLNTDWYISQMKRKAYESAPLPISLEYKNYIQGNNDQAYVMEKPGLEKGINLQSYIKLLKADDPFIKEDRGEGQVLTIMPSKKLFMMVDKNEALKAVPEKYQANIVDSLKWDIEGQALEKQALIILDMIANNHWERPIYFSTTLSSSNYLNLKEYTQLEGLAQRLLPVKVPGNPQGWVDTEIMYSNMTKNFFWRGLDDPKVYYDENFLRFPMSTRTQFYKLASSLYNEGNKEKAKEATLYCLKVMPNEVIPYDFTIPPFISILLKTGEDKKALEIATIMGDRCIDDLEYFTKNKIAYNRDYEMCFYILDQIQRALKESGKTAEGEKYEKALMQYSSGFNG